MEPSAAAPVPAQEETEEKMEEMRGELETLEEMLSRHKKEIADLQNKELSMKKAAAKGSKAEQKAKKKQVEDEMSKHLSDLKTKHVKEVASLGYNTNGKEKSGLDTLLIAMSGVSVGSKASKPSKSAKNRERRAKQEAEREQRIQEEQRGITSDRMIENEKLEKKLEPLGLIVKEIKPDGHCLYRAIEDQLSLNSGNLTPYGYQELRQIAAKYMREHAPEFLPFLLSDAEVDVDNSSEKFEHYCREVESTAAWGGQLELGALTHCLRKHFIIYSGSFPQIEMGREYRQESGSSSPNPSIMLSYHKHAYGLGEHYNSVVPVGL